VQIKKKSVMDLQLM